MLLIFTNKSDVHADHLIRSAGDLPILRINSEDFLTEYETSLTITDTGEPAGWLADRHGRRISFFEPAIAWYRKPSLDFSSSGFSGDYYDLVKSEAKAFFDIMFSLPGIYWVNSPFRAHRAKSKFQQLLFARKYGIQTPETIITNDPGEARRFFERFDGNIVTKSIYTANIEVDGLNRAIPTTKFHREEFFERLNLISLCPTQLQRQIQKKYELRVTVIGERVFATKIDSQSIENPNVDSRLDIDLVPHGRYWLPEELSRFCVDLVRAQGLDYGAIDFIRGKDDVYYFLENNPFGQYLWLELATGDEITSALLDFFQKKLGELKQKI